MAAGAAPLREDAPAAKFFTDTIEPERLLKRTTGFFLTRREFARRSGLAAAAYASPGALAAELLKSAQGAPGLAPARVPVTLDPGTLKRFVDPLPIPAVARPDGKRPSPANAAEKLPFYPMTMGEFEARVHRDLPPTRQWGFNGASPGPTIEARSGEGVLVEWANELPQRHLFTIDHNLHGAERDKPDVRAVVHLHGAKVPPESDGYPESWFVRGKSAMCYYPNRQDACLLWYHDHAMGINRLNIYAGLMGLYVLRDEAEDALGLPHGEREIPLVVCDRAFTQDGQLSYEVSPDPAAPWVPEVYGNTKLVNGKLFPYLDVQPALYRFRVLNGSNAQFLDLSLSNGQSIAQIGTEQGLLPAPVNAKIVSVAPGERVDIVIDFSGHGGEQIVLNTERIQEVMQFRVARGISAGAGPSRVSLPAKLRPVVAIPESAAVRTRLLTLREYKSPKGESMTMLLGGAHWDMPITENPTLDTVEIWSLINLTEDVHPIHLHLVRFQVLDRRPFDQFHYFQKGELSYIGNALPPDATEAGWKDTVRADPQMVTRIIARFEGYAGRYVWHCHILEHEDNEMMRPYEVVKAAAQS
jgi:spore coat protein A, manganese oxidase